ncbi:LCP family protein [Virgibacillus halophilus]|uniref:LCP family protein n=1 Tax=Tigheibacillus halophilus TaxID=361280 RepID=UPI00362CBD84
MKKRNIFLIVMITICILIAGAVVYGMVMFKQGMAEGDNQQDKKHKPTKELPFQEEEVSFGEIKVLLLGEDSREKEAGRSDTLMIAYYNQQTKEAKIVSIMRDSYVKVPGHGMQKINAAYAFGGPELVRQTIAENFGVDVNYYAIVDFAGFPKLVDLIAPDGIEVDIKQKMSEGIGETLYPGKQVLHGKELLGYVRFRHDAESDFGRVKRQQEVLSKLKDEAMRLQSLVKLPKIMGVAEAYIDTNIDKATMFSVGKGLLTTKKQLEKLRLPVDGSYTNERTQAGAVLRVDMKKNKEILQSFFAEQQSTSKK